MSFFGEDWSDPKTALWLSLASGLLGGRGNLAQNASAGLLGGLQAYQGARKMQMLDDQHKQEMELKRLQIEGAKRPQSPFRVVGNAVFDEANQRWLTPPAAPQQPKFDITEGKDDRFAVNMLDPTQPPIPLKVGVRPRDPSRFTIEAQQRDDAKSRVSGNLQAIKDAYDELQAAGGAIKTGGSPVENAVNSMAATSPGQIVGRAIGTRSQAARDRINQLRPMLIQEIRQATQMGARGLDSNRELEFYLAAATDPKYDIDTNMAAIDILDKAYGLGLGVNSNTQSRNRLRSSFKTQGVSSGPKAGDVVDGYRFKGGDPNSQANWEEVK